MALADYITQNFPTIVSQLSWDSISLPVIVAKTLEFYGVATEALATDSVKLHDLADVAVWRQALNDIALDYSYGADNAQFSRNQAVENVRKNLAEAENKAIIYMPNYQMIIHTSDNNPDWSA